MIVLTFIILYYIALQAHRDASIQQKFASCWTIIKLKIYSNSYTLEEYRCGAYIISVSSFGIYIYIYICVCVCVSVCVCVAMLLILQKLGWQIEHLSRWVCICLP